MNPTFKKRVQEPYNEAWQILKTIRDDDSDEAWAKFRQELDKFSERINAVPKKSSPEYIRCEKEYLDSLYSVMLHIGDMAAYILEHGEENKEKTT